MAHVVTCFVRNRGELLFSRRSEAVGTYAGRWDGVSGHVEGDPAGAEADARRELREETGLGESALELVETGASLTVEGDEREFVVHPFLFESETRSVRTNEESAAVEWCDPTEMRARETVPRLWEAWRRVAPTVEDVRTDRTHGSAWISARALEALRDAAAEADGWDEVAETGRELRAARPSMAAVGNRVNRALSTAERTSEAVEAAAVRELDAAFDAVEAAARTLVRRLRDAEVTRVVTLSQSGTALAALRALDPAAALVAESRPEREGVDVAETLAAETTAAVTLTTEAALPAAVAGGGTAADAANARADGATERDAGAAAGVDAVVVGADAVLPGGSVVNKSGTAGLALAAREAGVPVYVVAARDKVRPAGEGRGGQSTTGDDPVTPEPSPREAVYDGDADVDVFAPAFERVPSGLVDGLATEDGRLDEEGVRAVAAEHAAHATWDA